MVAMRDIHDLIEVTVPAATSPWENVPKEFSYSLLFSSIKGEGHKTNRGTCSLTCLVNWIAVFSIVNRSFSPLMLRFLGNMVVSFDEKHI
jgi:hypothetical protein